MITVNNLQKIYGRENTKVEALKSINMNIQKGEFVSIMGPSGSGKSTLLNILGCLDRSTMGDYILNNIPIHEVTDEGLADIRNKEIGFVFQSFNLLPKLNSIKNVELPLIYMGTPKEKRKELAISALKKVGLEERMHHKPNELSGGQKQRVAIARAIVTNPSIILADEPTGNLDSKSTNDILNLFKDLNEEGKTIIMVTHEDEVALITKRRIIFRDGNIETDKEVI
jgi:putative ABC transport system ATP-binding protein